MLRSGEDHHVLANQAPPVIDLEPDDAVSFGLFSDEFFQPQGVNLAAGISGRAHFPASLFEQAAACIGNEPLQGEVARGEAVVGEVDLDRALAAIFQTGEQQGCVELFRHVVKCLPAVE